MLSRTVSKLLQISCHMFVFDRGIPLFNTLMQGDLPNLELRNLQGWNGDPISQNPYTHRTGETCVFLMRIISVFID